jgi:hypothetical protein
MHYWEDPASRGWDVVVQAETEAAARSITKEKIRLEAAPSEHGLMS